MANQQYFCEQCRYAGSVEYQDRADMLTVLRLIVKDHEDRKPSCAQDWEKMIRIRNVELCDDACWAKITGGKVG